MSDVTVTQRHRDAAADLYLVLDGETPGPAELAEADAHRRGDYDAHPAVQAFARFEQEAFARHRAPDAEPVAWRPIESAKLWETSIVTDGEQVAFAQMAESDFGEHYWAVEPEDGLEWEPTLWTPWPPVTHPAEPVAPAVVEAAGEVLAAQDAIDNWPVNDSTTGFTLALNRRQAALQALSAALAAMEER